MQNVEQLDAQPDKPLADAWRKLSEPWRPLGQDSQAQTENLYSRLLKSRCLVSTKRQFTRLLFSSALKKVVSPARDDTFPRGFDLSLQSFSSTGSISRASHQKTHLAAAWRVFFLKSKMDLAGDGFCGRWSERGCTHFDSFFQKWTFHAHETTDFESKKSLEMQGVRKCVFRVDETPLFGKQKLQVREFSHNWGPKLQGLWRRLGRYSPERFF